MIVRVALALVAGMLAFAAPAAAETLHYEFGPVPIAPGQNTIEIAEHQLKPPVDGWITGFRPNLVYKDGTVPRVDVIHLHHGVWLKNLAPQFAAGEEKTTFTAPPGYGWRHRTTDRWFMNHMIHNLTPTKTEVYITYDLDFVPDTDPAAAAMQEIETVWLDVMGLKAYPVFDARRGKGGRDGRLTYPDEVPGAPRHSWTVPEDGALVGTAGHLHPGGLWTDLTLTRDGRTTRLFRSRAKYFEPAGAVSWDVAMTVTPLDWRVGLRKGDVVRVSGTYDTKRASWYESMAIMPTMFDPGGTGADPFAVDVDVEGATTHGHLAENDQHGGERWGALADPRDLLARPLANGGSVGIQDFVYGQGDLSDPGKRGRPAQVREGGAADVRQPRGPHGHAHDHRVPRALQPLHGHRLPARGRQGRLRLRQPRLRPGELHRGREPRAVEDAARVEARHLHVLLPRASVHARGVQGEAAGVGLPRSSVRRDRLHQHRGSGSGVPRGIRCTLTPL